MNGIREKHIALAAGLLIGLFVFAQQARSEDKADEPKEVLFANDLGPATVDVSSYPVKLQKTYRSTLRRCAKCHSLSRVLNSQFAEASEEELAELKKKYPKAFADEKYFTADAGLWKRYVKRMQRKPGSGIKKKEAKKIWEFLVYDSKVRKLKDPKKWVGHRKRLLAEFKKKFPKKYEEHYGEH